MSLLVKGLLSLSLCLATAMPTGIEGVWSRTDSSLTSKCSGDVIVSHFAADLDNDESKESLNESPVGLA